MRPSDFRIVADPIANAVKEVILRVENQSHATSVELIRNDPHSDSGLTLGRPRTASAPITLWLLDLEIDDVKATRWFTELAKDEQERANRFIRPEDRRRFVACRYHLRQILGRLCGAPASELRFDYGAHGKPELFGVSGLHFSVAHSGGVGLVATCSVAPVGVDLEVLTLNQELAYRVLTETELAKFQSYSGNRAELFLKYWTGKEAFLKLWGVGLSVEPNTIQIDWQDPPVCLPLGIQAGVSSACLGLVPIRPGTICAIACELPPLAVVKRMDLP